MRLLALTLGDGRLRFSIRPGDGSEDASIRYFASGIRAFSVVDGVLYVGTLGGKLYAYPTYDSVGKIDLPPLC